MVVRKSLKRNKVNKVYKKKLSRKRLRKQVKSLKKNKRLRKIKKQKGGYGVNCYSFLNERSCKEHKIYCDWTGSICSQKSKKV